MMKSAKSLLGLEILLLELLSADRPHRPWRRSAGRPILHRHDVRVLSQPHLWERPASSRLRLETRRWLPRAHDRLRSELVLPTVDGTIPDGMPRWSDLKNLAQRAEAVSFDSLWVPDHLLFQDARAEGEIRFIYKPPNYYSMAAPLRRGFGGRFGSARTGVVATGVMASSDPLTALPP